MADISSDQLDDLIKQLTKSAGSLSIIAGNKSASSSGGGISSSGGANTNNKKTHKEFNQGVSDSVESLKYFTSGTRGFTHAINGLATKLAGGFVIAEIAKYAEKEVETYKMLTNYGESFGGSMIKMTQAAGAAGLPLEAFAQAIKHNSVAFKQLGEGGFGKLSKGVRELADRYGDYGYSLDEINGITLDYADIQRKAGKDLKSLTGPQTAKDINDFALNISTMSEVLGTSREEILKNTKTALDDSGTIAQMRLNNVNGLSAYNKAIQTAVSDLAAQPGVAGEMLSKGLSQSFGKIGGAMFSDLGKEFIEAGQSGGIALLDEANRRIAAGEDQTTVTMDLVSKMKAELSNPDTVRSLQLQAQAGNKSAESLLELGANIKTYTKAEIDAAAKAKKSNNVLTNFMSAFESIIGGLKGSFIDGFLSPFTNAAGELDKDKVDAFFKSFKDLEPQFKSFGMAMGDIFRKVFTPTNISSLLSGIVIFSKVMMNVIPVVAGFFTVVSNGIVTINKFFEGLFNGFGLFGKSLSDTHKGLAAMATAATALAAFLGAKVLIAKLGSWVKNLFGTLFGKTKTATMMVNAGEVFVNGGKGGGGGGGNGPGDFDTGGKEGKAAKSAAKAAKEEESLRKAVAKGKKLGLAGEELEQYALKNRGGILGKLGRGTSRGLAGLAGLAGKVIPKTGLLAGLMGHAGNIASAGAKIGGGILGKVGGAFVPLVGAGIEGMAAVDAANNHHNVAAGLYGAGAAVNGVGAALDATGVGAVAGIPLGLIGGGLGLAGLAADVFDDQIGKLFTKKPDNPNAANPTDATNSNQPRQINEDDLVNVKYRAGLGDEKAANLLQKLNDLMEKQIITVSKDNKLSQSISRQNINAIYNTASN